jgi:hypothetical protein
VTERTRREYAEADWTAPTPGALQGNLVPHCGESTAGFYLATLLAVDVATLWTELRAARTTHRRPRCFNEFPMFLDETLVSW